MCRLLREEDNKMDFSPYTDTDIGGQQKTNQDALLLRSGKDGKNIGWFCPLFVMDGGHLKENW